jgi:hypothetical protein
MAAAPVIAITAAALTNKCLIAILLLLRPVRGDARRRAGLGA